MKAICLAGLSLCMTLLGASANEVDPSRSQWQQENAETKTHFSATVTTDAAQRPIEAFVIPIHGQISEPQLFILRRGLKDAIRNNVSVVVLDMDTPGGKLSTMLEMMQALDRFQGETITYVNEEAISAGAFIAVATDAIYFHPNGIMGAAEPITSTGQDIDEGAKRKIESYLDAKVRTISRTHRYRSDVLRAMMKPDFEFKIGDKVISPKGDLLTLTALEAKDHYGEPPAPLLSKGSATTLNTLLESRYGAHKHVVTHFEITWSEALAKWLNVISPILMGLGMLAIFVEFKTPGFGIFGIIGVLCLGVVFASSYVAGLAGHEPLIVFAVGLLCLAAELFILPGMLVFGLLGISMILGSLLWTMMDVWPLEGIQGLNLAMFHTPLIKLTLALIVAVIGAILLTKLLPRSWFLDKILLNASVGQSPREQSRQKHIPEVGSKGVTITKLFPSGEVEIDGRRFLATVNSKMLDIGTPIIVTAHNGFQLIVEVDKAQ